MIDETEHEGGAVPTVFPTTSFTRIRWFSPLPPTTFLMNLMDTDLSGRIICLSVLGPQNDGLDDAFGMTRPRPVYWPPDLHSRLVIWAQATHVSRVDMNVRCCLYMNIADGG